MSVGLAMIFGALLGGIEIRDRIKQRNAADLVNARGGLDPIDYTKHNMFEQDFYRDWNGERKNFRKDYIPYLEKNPKALASYIFHLAQHEEWMRGLRPVEAPIDYDKRTFNALARFDGSRYGEYIRIYNQTGIMYY